MEHIFDTQMADTSNSTNHQADPTPAFEQWLYNFLTSPTTVLADIRARNLSREDERRELTNKARVCVDMVHTVHNAEYLAGLAGFVMQAELYRAKREELMGVYVQLGEAAAEAQAKSWKWGAALDQVALGGEPAAEELLRSAPRGNRRAKKLAHRRGQRPRNWEGCSVPRRNRAQQNGGI
ncbi:hypothetical protein AK830_g10047 [Neonectria ditissima]|uniref:Uncharacterized protein n=1 Tax=Neonectria ditissima TaxID=78410 RepID=A0A0N8H5L7_9HYPO|nr:hypothetical protein AK830_g10047 [Neonectria ditissima]